MSTNLPDSLMIKAYLEGKLDHENMYKLEKQALEDPFLWEALDGYAQTSNSGTELSILQRQLHERIVHLQENKKVFDYTWQRLSVAASAAVLFITAGILFWMNIHRSGPSAERQVQVSLIDPDSLRTEIQGTPNRPVIRAKEYPNSSEETKIAALPPESVENNQEETAASSSSISSEIASTLNNNQSTRLPVEGRETKSRILTSSADMNASQQAIQPVPGWDIYRKYLEDNIRLPAFEPKISGSVLLYFEIDEKGKPNNFQVLKGLTEACNMEAIRLIKEGPSWKTTIGSKIRNGRIEVRF